MNLLAVFLIVIRPIGGMVLVSGFAYAVFKTGLGPRWIYRALSKGVIWVFLPALLFSKLALATHLLEAYPLWWILPLSTQGVFLSGALVGGALSRLVPRRGRDRTLSTHMTVFHNAGYLPLVLVRGVFPGFEDLDVLVMLYILGTTPILWSVSPAVLSAGTGAGFQWRKMLNPPLVTISLGFLAMMTGLADWLALQPMGGMSLREWTLLPLGLVGELTVPAILIVLGGTLSELPVTRPQRPRLIGMVLLGKLVALPLLGLLLVPRLGLPLPLLLVILVETMTPPALNLTVQSREFGSIEEAERISEVTFYAYIASVATLTVFLTALKYLVLRGVIA